MTEPSFEQQKREKRIERVLNYLKIDDFDDDYDDSNDDIYDVKRSEHIYDISEKVVDKQQEIFLKTGVLVSLNEIMKKAIIRGLRDYKF